MTKMPKLKKLKKNVKCKNSEREAGSHSINFECGICQKEFATSWCLQIHIQTHNEKKKFDCQECGESFSDVALLCEHFKEHILGENLETCLICGKDYPCSEIEAHKRSHIFKPGLTCNICGKSFGSKQVLVLHLRSHGARDPFKCSVCGLQFASRNSFTQHWNSHLGQKGCEKIGIKTQQKKDTSISKHGNNLRCFGIFIKDGKRFTCVICNKSIANKGKAQQHAKFHALKKKPSYDPKSPCQSEENLLRRGCGGKRTKQKNIKLKQKAHLGEKTPGVKSRRVLSCSECDKRFRDPEELQKHKNVHIEELTARLLRLSSPSGNICQPLEPQLVLDAVQCVAGKNSKIFTKQRNIQSQSVLDLDESGECEYLVPEQLEDICEESSVSLPDIFASPEQEGYKSSEKRLPNLYELTNVKVVLERLDMDKINQSMTGNISHRLDDRELKSGNSDIEEDRPSISAAQNTSRPRESGSMEVEFDEDSDDIDDTDDHFNAVNAATEVCDEVLETTLYQDSVATVHGGPGAPQANIGCSSSPVKEPEPKSDNEGEEDADTADDCSLPDPVFSDDVEADNDSSVPTNDQELSDDDVEADNVSLGCTNENRSEAKNHKFSHFPENEKQERKALIGYQEKKGVQPFSDLKLCLENKPEQIQRNRSASIKRNYRKVGNKFVCSICEKSFDKTSIYKHVYNHLVKQKHTCKFCGQVRERKCHLIAHEKLHIKQHATIGGVREEDVNKIKEHLVTEGKMHSCKKCSEIFKLHIDAYRHVFNHFFSGSLNTDLSSIEVPSNENKRIPRLHEALEDFDIQNGTYTCSKCGTELHTKNSAYVHFKRHITTPSFSCSQCSFAAYTRHHLDRHMKTHLKRNKNFDFICAEDENAKLFTSKEASTYIQEENNHFKCKICDKILKNRVMAIAHVIRHNHKARFRCKFCDYYTYTRHHLERHARRHLQYKQFSKANKLPETDGQLLNLSDENIQDISLEEDEANSINNFNTGEFENSWLTSEDMNKDSDTREDRSSISAAQNTSRPRESGSMEVEFDEDSDDIDDTDDHFNAVNAAIAVCDEVLETTLSQASVATAHGVPGAPQANIGCSPSPVKEPEPKSDNEGEEDADADAINDCSLSDPGFSDDDVEADNGSSVPTNENRSEAKNHKFSHFPEPEKQERKPLIGDQEEKGIQPLSDLKLCLEHKPKQIQMKRSASIKRNYRKVGNKYVCSICAKSFDKTSIHKHVYNHLVKQKHTCKFCGHVLERKCHLIAHEQLHIKQHATIGGVREEDVNKIKDYLVTEGKMHSCKKCPEIFRLRIDAYRHVFSHFFSGSLNTDLSSIEVPSNENKRKPLIHEALEDFDIQNGTYTCSKCGTELHTKKSAYVHFKRHITTPSFSCSQCSFAAYTRHHLDRHMNTHLKRDKNFDFICTEDENAKLFTSQEASTYIQEENNHFKCKICDKILKNRVIAIAHVIRHNHKARFRCKVCDYYTHTRHHLERHARRHIQFAQFSKANQLPETDGQLLNLSDQNVQDISLDEDEANSISNIFNSGEFENSWLTSEDMNKDASFISEGTELKYDPFMLEHSIASENPTIYEKQSISEIPTISGKTTIFENPTASENTMISVNPTASENPSASENQTPSQKPKASENPSPSEKQTSTENQTASENPSASENQTPTENLSASENSLLCINRTGGSSSRKPAQCPGLSEQDCEDVSAGHAAEHPHPDSNDTGHECSAKRRSQRMASKPQISYEERRDLSDEDDNSDQDSDFHCEESDDSSVANEAEDKKASSLTKEPNQPTSLPPQNCVSTTDSQEELNNSTTKVEIENNDLEIGRSFHLYTSRREDYILKTDGQYLCKICKKTFAEKRKCFFHVDYHLSHLFSCPKCAVKTTCKAHMITHLKTHKVTFKTNFSCETCKENFKTYFELSRHNKTHTDEEKMEVPKYIKCESCGDICKSSSMLFSHQLRHLENFQCGACKSEFKSAPDLENHLLEEGHYKCEQCDKVLSSFPLMEEHMQSIHDSSFLKKVTVKKETSQHQSRCICMKCHKGFPTKKDLHIHERQNHGAARYICVTCHKGFPTKKGLHIHEKQNHGVVNDDICCDVCNEPFDKPEKLARHKQVHTSLAAIGEDTTGVITASMKFSQMLPCPVCSKKYTTVGKLKEHLRIHSERQFVCDICGLKFLNHNYFLVHERLHKNIKPYHCKQCPRKFAAQSLLKTHIKNRHSGKVEKKYFKCNVCDKLLVKDYMHTHMRTHLKRDKNFPCAQCGRSFYSKEQMKAHTRTHEDRSFVCDVCGLSLRNKYALKYHKEIHTGIRPFVCEECGKDFRQKMQLQRHMLTHTKVKDHVCEFCNKRFSLPETLKNHRNIHTGEKPYKCKFCDLRFSDRWARFRHEKQHVEKDSKKVQT